MRLDIKERIEQVRRGEVPEGYRISDFGIVPMIWKEKPIGSVIMFYNEKSTSDNQYPVLTSSRRGLCLQTDYFEDQVTRDKNTGYNIIPYGYITYRSRSDDGTFTFNKNSLIDKGIVSCFYPVFSVDNTKVNEHFLLLFLNHYIERQILKEIVGTSQLVLSEKKLCSLRFLCPHLSEQEKIVEILSHYDKAISLKQQLIDEKRRQKKWLMRNLLDPDSGVRLPGFEGEWKKKIIGSLADVCTGATPSTVVPEYWNGNIPWMNSGELNKKRVFDVVGRITELGLQNSGTRIIPKNCVLIGLAGQGKTRGTVAINHIKLSTNQSIAAIIPRTNYSPEYLYHNLDYRYNELRRISSGDGQRGGLNLELIRAIDILLPSIAEQTAIANVLSAADREIDLLEQELTEWKTKKKALIQLLLTGIVRV